LVVDDNQDSAQMLAELLELKGYVTRVAFDAPDALRVAGEFAPDIALVDLGLPVMDGCELASRLRTVPGLAEVRLIAITGYGQESDRRRARDAGFHHHLVKPVNLRAVEAAIAQVRG
jgi:CheY-like chemotaxis protein